MTEEIADIIWDSVKAEEIYESQKKRKKLVGAECAEKLIEANTKNEGKSAYDIAHV